MSKPVWILLPHLADWRWMEQIETTPWYPSARLFRQYSPGDWPGVVERVAGQLRLLLRSLSGSTSMQTHRPARPTQLVPA